MAKLKQLDNLRHDSARLFTDLQRNFPGVRSILVTGCAGGEGVTSLCIAMARAVIRLRKSRILIVDANFDPKTRGLSQLLRDGRNNPGLRDILGKPGAREGNPGSLLGDVATLEDGIDVLPRGISTTVEMADLESAGLLSELNRQALRHYDFVLWDAETINTSSETKTLMSEVQDVILVVESDVSRVDHFASSIAEIRQLRANLLSVVRNRAGQRMFSVGADQQ